MYFLPHSHRWEDDDPDINENDEDDELEEASDELELSKINQGQQDVSTN